MIEHDQFMALINAEDFDPDANDDDDFNDRLTLLGEKETLTTILEKYKEYMENSIQKVEKDITKRIKDEWNTIENRIKTNQHARNRAIVTEVMETCHAFTGGIEQLFE